MMLSALMSTMAIVSCSNDQASTETFVTTTFDTTAEVSSTEVPTGVETTVAPMASTSSTTNAVVSTTTVAKSTTTSASNSSVGSGAPTSTIGAANRPKLSVSQVNNLNPNGTTVTVRGTGYDVNKGVYVIVCTQAAPGPQATCIGGVNIDGSSSSSVWVSSNPPNYAIGLTTPFSPDGSFTVELVVVAKSGALDCTVLKCGVVTRSDHLRYTDRTQDIFVPITFSNQ
jgi:hypothetical protein